MKTYDSFTQAYVRLVKKVYGNYEYESAPRGMKIREKLGVSFRINNIRDRIPYVQAREFSISYMIAECLWYLTGNNSTEWISKYAPFWKTISDDGQTANSAYGARIFKQHKYHDYDSNIPHGWTQWQYVIDELKKDSDSRRAVIHIRMPQDSYLAKKDVPCTLALQFFIRNGALHQVASMRSSDLILGIAYDVPAFTMFQELLANELGVACGTYTHVSNSLHIYERHYEMCEQILSEKPLYDCLPMPELPIESYQSDITKLVSAEYDFTAATNTEELLALTAKAEYKSQYFNDWGLILASSKAQKLKDKTVQQQLINAVGFAGYKAAFRK
jgi:thymidylate synthase